MHSKIIEILVKLQVPGWLLKIMISYFKGRKLKLRFKGLISKEKDLNACVGQGCLLGLWCFLVLLNFAGPSSIPQQIGLTITENQKSRKPIPIMKKKYVDDLSIMTSIDLKKVAVHYPNLRAQGPLSYHKRTQHYLLCFQSP